MDNIQTARDWVFDTHEESTNLIVKSILTQGLDVWVENTLADALHQNVLLSKDDVIEVGEGQLNSWLDKIAFTIETSLYIYKDKVSLTPNTANIIYQPITMISQYYPFFELQTGVWIPIQNRNLIPQELIWETGDGWSIKQDARKLITLLLEIKEDNIREEIAIDKISK